MDSFIQKLQCENCKEKCPMNELTLNEIADYFRKKYPKATQVILKVGYHGYTIAAEEYHDVTRAFTTRTLDGEWLEAQNDKR